MLPEFPQESRDIEVLLFTNGERLSSVRGTEGEQDMILASEEADEADRAMVRRLPRGELVAYYANRDGWDQVTLEEYLA